jgi:hypothetical protein
LKFARKNAREAQIESELLFAYAKTGRLADLEDFISSPNIAQVCLNILKVYRLPPLEIAASKKKCSKPQRFFSPVYLIGDDWPLH